MFYLEDIENPQGRIVIGTEEFERVIRNFVINIEDLTFTQYQTFKGTLYAFDLLDELLPSLWSRYVVRFSSDE